MSISDDSTNPSNSPIYLDHNATTPMDPRVAAQMRACEQGWGNPSSVHGHGRQARMLVESARRNVAGFLAAAPEEVVFTSGGTEADLYGLVGLARVAAAHGRPRRIVLAQIEHPAVLGAADLLAEWGFETVWVAVDENGRIDANAFAAACEGGLAVAAAALANHEIGTLQNIPNLAALAHAAGGYFHCDAVQAAGKISMRVRDLGADTVAVSAHKMYGPKGAGCLWIRRGIDVPPLFAGGHQERGRRPGTENVAGIVGFGAAAEIALAERGEEVTEPGCAVDIGDLPGGAGVVLSMSGSAASPEAWSANAASIAAHTAELENGLAQIPGVSIYGTNAPRVGNTINARIAGALGEAVVCALDLEGIACSTGAACTSGSVEPSRVLLALGVPREHAVESIRLSLGRGTRASDVERLLAVLPAIVERARAFR